MQINEIYNRECLEAMKEIESNSIDCIIKDPPYGILTGHKIETTIDIDLLMSECFRVLKKDSFLAFFGQMPTIIDFYNAAIKAGFTFKIDIVWSKMNASPLGTALKRMHENIYVFKKGNPPLNEVIGKYEDVAQSMCMHGLMNVESIFKTLSFLKSKLKGNNPKQDKTSSKTNDELMGKMLQSHNIHYSQSLNKDTKNFSTIWAFQPFNQKHRNPNEGQIKHPTVKSLEVLDRLVKLLSKENDTILDPFIGSGTTAIAAVNTNRNYLGFELDKQYFDIAEERIRIAKSQLKLF